MGRPHPRGYGRGGRRAPARADDAGHGPPAPARREGTALQHVPAEPLLPAQLKVDASPDGARKKTGAERGGGVTTTQSPRSVLFFPGTRPDRYGKALASGADVVCLDLEDAVAEDEKHVARDHAARLVSSNRWEAPRAMIRINHPASPDGREDLRAILAAAAAGPVPLRLMLPKTDGPGDLDVV